MEIKLPFNPNPIINTYSDHANLVSIISNYFHLIPWIYQRFLRLTYCKDNQYLDFCDGEYFDYYRCNVKYIEGKKYLAEYRNNEILDQEDVTKEVASEEICHFVLQSIDQSYYIIIHLDHYFIKNSDVYGMYHRTHASIIYGYDLSRRVFFVADNFNFGKYMSIEVGFDELVTARRIVETVDMKMALRIRVKKHVDVSLNITEVSKKLMEYVNGEDSSNYGIITESYENYYYYNGFKYDWHWHEYKNNEMFIYGVNIHTFFAEDMNIIINEKKSLDIRRYQALLNHKTVIKELVNYMTEKSLMTSCEQLRFKLIEIEKKSYIARNMAIKYNLNFDLKILDKLKAFHEGVIEKETELIKNIIERISSS
ncbi:hypothetical protein M3629_23845 [Paenibacillus polysaccharolyticus]|uniref:hypothetical protein n=1 Tax=Paenibacillus polysaccharolyticus TaxID=582692 RepID=UPI00203E8D72|nr:hypothetical protein [Paenibacillus polysaccharolyticus]MCM3135816.1 hypothetical protein [Paenibacillus polysaccharolyticus]